MVDFKKLGDRAKDLVEKRGGTEALKADAAELRKIAKGKGSLSDKAKAAAAAIKDEGKAGEEKDRGAERPPGADKPEAGDKPKPAGEPEAPTGP